MSTGLGAMQDWSMRVTHVIDHAAREAGTREIVTHWADGSETRTDWAGIRRDALKMAQALTLPKTSSATMASKVKAIRFKCFFILILLSCFAFSCTIVQSASPDERMPMNACSLALLFLFSRPSCSLHLPGQRDRSSTPMPWHAIRTPCNGGA